MRGVRDSSLFFKCNHSSDAFRDGCVEVVLTSNLQPVLFRPGVLQGRSPVLVASVAITEPGFATQTHVTLSSGPGRRARGVVITQV